MRAFGHSPLGHSQNGFEHPVQVGEDVRVPNAQRTVAFGFQEGCAFGIADDGVLAAVEPDDQPPPAKGWRHPHPNPSPIEGEGLWNGHSSAKSPR